METIKINNIEWQVAMTTNKSMPMPSNDENIVNMGRTFSATKRIYINKDMDLDSKKETFIHELTHAFIHQYGFSQVAFNHEIVADFIGQHYNEMNSIIKDVFDRKILEGKWWAKIIGISK